MKIKTFRRHGDSLIYLLDPTIHGDIPLYEDVLGLGAETDEIDRGAETDEIDRGAEADEIDRENEAEQNAGADVEVEENQPTPRKGKKKVKITFGNEVEVIKNIKKLKRSRK